MADLRIGTSGLPVFLIIFLLETISVRSEYDLSDYTTVCSAKDPRLKECFIRSATDMLGNLMNGLPDFGIPVVDPFLMGTTVLEQPDIGMNLTIMDTQLYGFSKGAVTDATAEPEKFRFDLNLLIPKITILGTYEVRGKIFIMPIYGDGPINITLFDVKIGLQLSGKPEMEKDGMHMKLTDTSLSIDPKKAKITFYNLFNGNKMLGSIMNGVVNQGWREIFVSIRPRMERVCAEEVLKVWSVFFSRFPYNKLFNDLDI